MRRDTIDECRKVTARLIKEYKEKLLDKTQILETLINTKIDNQATKMMEFTTFFQASFQRLENHISIAPKKLPLIIRLLSSQRS